MTVVIAQIRNEEILVLADTKVQDRQETGPDTMPGRLKIVTLGHRFTVAFAGAADPAHLAVKEAAKLVALKQFEHAIECLKSWSNKHDIDFITASHQPRARLCRIRRGVALDIPDICSIGDTSPFHSQVEAARISTEDGPLRQSNLRSRFIDRLLTNKNLGDVIGGFPTAVEATSAGHRYLTCSGFYTYKFPTMKSGQEIHQSVEEVYSGEGHFQLSVMPIIKSDIPVMGVCLLQARTGYVYSPLLRPSGRSIKLLDRTEWEGYETEMYRTLQKAMDEEVETLSRMFPKQFVITEKTQADRI
ncbi:hypothetical protein [Rhizobium rosettiformans]|jgi:hypothetical protein|uniref:hypothetical protein n=1 Tax=Rhizobium rosettiformans TaxID=1368430 RepID=UPI00285739C6|nr:hypothetical protein [Rhizobium rosettiformans]MDR7031257.1 hypothetical protein [Rhizobium rosettiformans]MDR7067123.1 hypothetical protein [Rhizobium rosettiformans]